MSEQNYVLMKLSYSEYLVFPAKYLKDINSILAECEIYKSNYGEEPKIAGMSKDYATLEFISREEYLQCKTNSVIQEE